MMDRKKRKTRNKRIAVWIVLVAIFEVGLKGLVADEIVIGQAGAKRTIEGEILVEAEDGSLLFRGLDGRLWIIEADELEEKQDDDDPVEPIDEKALGKQLLAELPEGFRIHIAGDFVIAYDTERGYARWIGGLYQRLRRGFEKYWQRKRFKLDKPRFPLPVIIFSNKAAYDRYLAAELGNVPGDMVAYYNLLTNRVVMYDLTDGRRAAGADPGNSRRISEVLSDPRAIPMVATVIHEGTHQLIFNMGMQTRFAEAPLWLNEGLAMYFETPDLSNSRGWRAIGKVNPIRMTRFRNGLATRPADSLRRMISSDDRFRQPGQVLDAYAEAWAFNYFLLNRHADEFVAYLKHMAEKPRSQYDDPQTRVSEFRHFFDSDLGQLDREFVEFMRRAK